MYSWPKIGHRSKCCSNFAKHGRMMLAISESSIAEHGDMLKMDELEDLQWESDE